MEDPAHRYAAWKAPQQDGEILLWPQPAVLIDQARANNKQLSSSVALIQNVPLSVLRLSARLRTGETDSTRLIFATGHQTELHHPGVWAKNVLIDAASRTTGGRPIHFAVDTDAPKHLGVKFPGYNQPITDDPAAASAEWSGLLAPPTAAQLKRLSETFAAVADDWPFQPLLPDFLKRLSAAGNGYASLPVALSTALEKFDRTLGLDYSAVLVSPLWQSPAFLTLAHHLLTGADRFAANYNDALKAYRTRHHIRTPGRPMPELARKDDRCETPFWRDDLKRKRRIRAWVERSGDRWALSAGDDRFEFDPTRPAEEAANALGCWLADHQLRLAPRALTLTMALRLLIADQFVHGIGGGQYDQVTDDLIRRHFGIEPPRFCVTTATLHFPLAAGQKRTNIPELLQEGHRLRHGVLGTSKGGMVDAIESAPPRSARRQELFQDLHRRLDSAGVGNAELGAWAVKLQEASSRVVEERSLFDRELFYAIQPRVRLEGLIEAYRKRFR